MGEKKRFTKRNLLIGGALSAGAYALAQAMPDETGGSDTEKSPTNNEVRVPKGAPVYDDPHSPKPCGQVAADTNAVPAEITGLHDGLVRFAHDDPKITDGCGYEHWVHLPDGLDGLPNQ